MIQKLSRHIASRLRTLQNANVDEPTRQRNREEIECLCLNFMPSGSGFDEGTSFDFWGSKPHQIRFLTAYHHMNDVGMYDGWTRHMVTATAAWDGGDIKVTGRNRNDVKDYIAEAFDNALNQDIDAVFSVEDKKFSFRAVIY